MTDATIDQALAALDAARNDEARRRELAEAAARELLRSPPLAAQLVARIAAAGPEGAAPEHLAELLAATLDTARLAAESGQSRGDAVLAAAADAVLMARRRGTLAPDRCILLARLWTRAGVPAPAALELSQADAEAAVPADAVGVEGPAGAEIGSLLDDLLRMAGREAEAMHGALAESFPTMPAPLRREIVIHAAQRDDPPFERLGCLWLLDADPALRRAAAAGLAARQAEGRLSSEAAALLVVLRSWMPEDAARTAIDRLLREGLRGGALPGSGGAGPTPWTLHKVLASIPDGGGAQSWCAAVQSGRSRKLAMVLLKQGQGIKKAFALPCASAGRQHALMAGMAEETGAMPVTPALLRRALAAALAEGLEAGRPPPPGLVEVAALCGLADLRPEPRDTAAILAGLGATARLAALPARERGKRVAASRGWWDRHPMVHSWFEESDATAALFKGTPEPEAATALWGWFEGRRGWWAQIVARGAEVLDAAAHPDAESFAAVAAALLEGRALARIPVMEDVHAMTAEAWRQTRDRDGPAGGPQDDGAAPAPASGPAPERPGELAALLAGRGIGAEWIDGFVMAAVVAPRFESPALWLSPILDRAADQGEAPDRLIELVVARANAAIGLARDGAACTAHLAALPPEARQAWAAGFTAAVATRRPAWPARALRPGDRAMLAGLAAAAEGGLAPGLVPELAHWLAARYAAPR